MSHTNKSLLIAITVLVLATLTCNLGPVTISLNSPSATPTPAANGASSFGAITFAEDVTDDGITVKPGTNFASGTTAIWAFFHYTAMKPDTAWRREWKRDGKLVTGVDETWEEDESGWIAYPLEDETGIEGGNYTFTLYIEGKRVQEGTFTVAPRSQAVVQKMKLASFGRITFGEGFLESGQVVKPSTSFAGGITKVVALFDYANMVPGQTWGWLWEKDGKEYDNKPGRTWEKGSDGWRAFSISDENGIGSGHYTLSLFIDGLQVQQASFDIAPVARSAASFGPIIFARDIDADRVPIGSDTNFGPGTNQVYAIFPYLNMEPTQNWGKEWLRDGKVFDSGNWKWGTGTEGPEGVSYLYVNTPDKSPMLPGKYTLNLYLDGKLAQSASFVIGSLRNLGTPARPEDIIDPKLLPYWRKLAGMSNPTVREIAQLVLDFHIPMKIENLSGWGSAIYRSDPTRCDEPGQVIVLSSTFNNGRFDDMVALIAHELTHARESLVQAKSCSCTIDNEFWAYIVQIYVLQELGHQDWIRNSWGNPYDANGHFSEARLYKWIREHYVCPEQ